MNRIITIIIVVFFTSCMDESYKFELDDHWVILEMYFENESIYPNDITSKLSFDLVGFEGTEKIEFATQKSTILVPGFNTEEMLLKYKFLSEDSILIFLDSAVFNNHKLPLRRDYNGDAAVKLLTNKQRKGDQKSDSLNQVRQKIIEARGILSEQYKLPLRVYCGKYKFVLDEKEATILLISESTSMKLISQTYLIDERLDLIMQEVN